MNNVFTAKLLNNLRNKKGEKGFTLIELLVVVIIIGVLSAVALPNLLGQVGKARQTEAKTTVGSINRAQQSERLQTGTFVAIEDLPIGIELESAAGAEDGTGNNYVFSNQGVPDGTFAAVDASARAAFQNDILDYTGAVGQTSAGVFTALICENDAIDPTGAGANQAIDAEEDGTTEGVIACGTGSTPMTQ